jgi:hypothetical protein
MIVIVLVVLVLLIIVLIVIVLSRWMSWLGYTWRAMPMIIMGYTCWLGTRAAGGGRRC